jgi:CheY-like chemotaxis protein
VDCQPDLSGVSVLVVDDEPDACHLVKRVLEGCKASAEVASSGDEAYARLTARRFDVLISDIGMPNEDGYQFLRRVRDLPEERNGRIPAIALTAFARSEDRRRAAMAGYQTHVSKPVEAAELVAIVASLAGRV